MFRFCLPHADLRHILHIDRTAVTRRQKQQTNVRDTLQRLPCDHWQRTIEIAERADKKRPIGVRQFIDELIQRDPV